MIIFVYAIIINLCTQFNFKIRKGVLYIICVRYTRKIIEYGKKES